jgi:hypothetical protein
MSNGGRWGTTLLISAGNHLWWLVSELGPYLFFPSDTCLLSAAAADSTTSASPNHALTCSDQRISLTLAEQVACTPAAMERQGYGAYEGQSGAACAESMQMDMMAAATQLFLWPQRRLKH